MGAYFANWAQYHQAPYKHTAADIAPIAGKTDHVYFGFLYFCPPAGSPLPYWAQAPFGSCTDETEYQLMTLEPNDPDSIKTLVSQGPKVIASIGGWNFPSAYFSKMVATAESRQKFISGAKTFLSSNGMAGIDLDWEFPGSEARTDPVKISCEQFRQTEDTGGSSDDGVNLVQFLKELREGLGDDMYISVASQAAQKNWEAMKIKEGSPYVDHWHVMNYDYAVPDIEDGATMSPNAPLYTPSASGSLQMSIDYTIQGYIAAGVPTEKIMLGIPLYGHTWYGTGMSDWKSFGGQGSVQGECCGPFKSTFGAKPGKACSQCGVMMYSEILAAGCSTTYDDETKSDIMYCDSAGQDGYTEAGTWITYNDKKSIHEITQYSIDKGLAGVFVFDTSMDTISTGENGGFTFELMNQIADDLSGSSPSPAPTPSPSPSPSPSSTFKCLDGQCVQSSSGGVDEATCNAICTPPSTYKCVMNQCVADASGGVSKDICQSVCGASFV